MFGDQVLRAILERVKGIEPSSLAWKAMALPLSYTRVWIVADPVDCLQAPPARRLPLTACRWCAGAQGLHVRTEDANSGPSGPAWVKTASLDRGAGSIAGSGRSEGAAAMQELGYIGESGT